jgi:signal transduction histidine kinase
MPGMASQTLPADIATDIEAINRLDDVKQILDVACQATGMGFAAIARVTDDRWICCAVRDEIAFGLQPGGELKVETTICHEIRQSRQIVVIDHVAEDKEYCLHPTPAMYGFQSYISVPIVLKDGTFFGTLCAIDPHPRLVSNPAVAGMFKLFAELIARQLESQARVETSERALSVELANADLREKFIAVLGHDLRNPLAALDGGLQLLRRTPLDLKAVHIVTLMDGTVRRMTRLVNDMLDLARARSAGGMVVQPDASVPLRPVLEQVIEEFRVAAPGRRLDADFAGVGDVAADPARIAQLLSNLLANAVSHGAKDGWIRVATTMENGDFVLSIANAGPPIPQDIRIRLFRPFVRGASTTDKGLGLGLYIASEIARAHGGSIEVESAEDQTRFTVRIPGAKRIVRN